jgi:hypothetical protein
MFSAAPPSNQPHTVARLRYAEADVPRLKHLCALLNFITNASPDYGLLKEQCYWFCSSVVEIIGKHFPRGQFIQGPASVNGGRYGTSSAPQATLKRAEIDRRFEGWLAETGMSIEICVFCEMKYLFLRRWTRANI